MKSCWIVNYKDGYSVILTEQAYSLHKERRDITKINDEEHWFNIEDAKRENPTLPIFCDSLIKH